MKKKMMRAFLAPNPRSITEFTRKIKNGHRELLSVFVTN